MKRYRIEGLLDGVWHWRHTGQSESHCIFSDLPSAASALQQLGKLCDCELRVVDPRTMGQVAIGRDTATGYVYIGSNFILRCHAPENSFTVPIAEGDGWWIRRHCGDFEAGGPAMPEPVATAGGIRVFAKELRNSAERARRHAAAALEAAMAAERILQLWHQDFDDADARLRNWT